jgi:hypothetical protein
VEDYLEKYILQIIFHHAKRFLTKRKSYDVGRGKKETPWRRIMNKDIKGRRLKGTVQRDGFCQN